MTNRMVIWVLAAGNVGLFFAVGFLWAERHGTSDATKGVRSSMESVPNSAVMNESSAPVGQFRWSQLESTNFVTYVANLRSVGCPEQTLRDIIAAEVQALYSPVQQAILQGENSTGRRLVSEREKLIRDQAWLVDHFLGGDRTPANSPGRSDTMLDSTEVDAGRSATVNPTTAPGLAAAGLRGAGVARSGQSASGSAVDQVSAGGFVFEAIAGSGSEARSDESAAQPGSRWRQARSLADQHLRVMIGDEAFLRFERERHLSAVRSQSAP